MFGIFDIKEQKFVHYHDDEIFYPVYANDEGDIDHLYFVLFQYKPGLCIKKFTEKEFEEYLAGFYDAVEASNLLNSLIKEIVYD